MKKLPIIAFIMTLLIVLTGCQLITTILEKINDNKVYTLSTKEDSFTLGDTKNIHDRYKSAGDNCIADSTSTLYILVIPVKFSGFNSGSLNIPIEVIEKAFFGDPTTDSTIMYESVKSYYEKSSYGNLTINGIVTDYQTLSHNSAYYENDESYSKTITNEALNLIDSDYDLSKYDNNSDGVVDGIYILYDKSIYSANTNIWWAHTGWIYENNNFDGVEVKPFVFASTSFIYYESIAKYGTKLGKIDSTVYIHETGHLLGADDYYDYYEEKGCNYGVGPDDMMSSNFGDHNAATKMLYGWIKPTVITRGTHTITLNQFSTSGEAIILNASYNDTDNIYDEYFVVDFFGNDYLDADSKTYMASKNKGLTAQGIRIYHVNSTITGSDGKNDGDYTSLFDCDNSDSDCAFITLVNAKNKTFTSSLSSSINNNYLYGVSSEFKSADLVDFNGEKTTQIVNEYNRYWEVKVDSISNDTVTITINYTYEE